MDVHRAFSTPRVTKTIKPTTEAINGFLLLPQRVHIDTLHCAIFIDRTIYIVSKVFQVFEMLLTFRDLKKVSRIPNSDCSWLTSKQRPRIDLKQAVFPKIAMHVSFVIISFFTD